MCDKFWGALQRFKRENESAIRGKTTKHVVDEIIKVKLKQQKVCWAAVCGGRDEVRKATHFVSHAWSRQFEDLVASVAEHQSKVLDNEGMHPDECFYWIDFFVVNQFGFEATTVNDEGAVVKVWEVEKHAFRMVIQNTACTVLCLDPWDNASAFVRAWCLYETMYRLRHTSEQGRRLFVAMSPTEEQRLALAFETSFQEARVKVQAAVQSIDTSKAGCYSQTDKLMIFGLIDEMYGGEGGNWFVAQVRRIVVECLLVGGSSVGLPLPEEGGSLWAELMAVTEEVVKEETQDKILRKRELLCALEKAIGQMASVRTFNKDIQTALGGLLQTALEAAVLQNVLKPVSYEAEKRMLESRYGSGSRDRVAERAIAWVREYGKNHLHKHDDEGKDRTNSNRGSATKRNSNASGPSSSSSWP